MAQIGHLVHLGGLPELAAQERGRDPQSNGIYMGQFSQHPQAQLRCTHGLDSGGLGADAPSKANGPASFIRAMSLPSRLGLYLLW